VPHLIVGDGHRLVGLWPCGHGLAATLAAALALCAALAALRAGRGRIVVGVGVVAAASLAAGGLAALGGLGRTGLGGQLCGGRGVRSVAGQGLQRLGARLQKGSRDKVQRR